MNQVQMRDALFALVPPDAGADWGDVLRRAHRPRRARRLTLVFAVGLLVMLAVGSALALSGRLGNLFRGTPVNDLTPRERFLMSEFDMTGKAELLTRRNGLAFYVIRGTKGRVCYSIGETRSHLTPAQREGRFRFGGASCVDPRIFPSRALPVLNQSYFSARSGADYRMVGVQGFAADAVDRIRIIGRDNEIVFTVPVEHNVYSAGRRGFLGARGVVALADDGKVLWVQCFAIAHDRSRQFSGGCGKYKNSPPPRFAPTPTPKRPPEPPNPVRQQGSAEGVTFTIRGSRIRADLSRVSPTLQRRLVYKDGRIGLGCFKLVKVGGSFYTRGASVSRPYAPVVEMSPWNPYAPRPVEYAPFDGCTMTGNYGHSWGDAHGTHDAVEVPLTERGRVYLAERAVARDVAWLTHARIFTPIRYAQRPFTSATAARRLGPHAVALPTAASTPPLGKLGIWIGPARRIVLAERTSTGRRLFVELRRGITYRTNLLGLARAF